MVHMHTKMGHSRAFSVQNGVLLWLTSFDPVGAGWMSGGATHAGPPLPHRVVVPVPGAKTVTFSLPPPSPIPAYGSPFQPVPSRTSPLASTGPR